MVAPHLDTVASVAARLLVRERYGPLADLERERAIVAGADRREDPHWANLLGPTAQVLAAEQKPRVPVRSVAQVCARSPRPTRRSERREQRSARVVAQLAPVSLAGDRVCDPCGQMWSGSDGRLCPTCGRLGERW